MHHPPPPPQNEYFEQDLIPYTSVSDSIKSFPNSTAIGRKI